MSQETTGFGIRMTITPTAGIAVTLLETEVTPVGYEGEEKIEQTTNANTKFKSFEPGDLVEKTEISGTCAYDTAALANIKLALNVKGVIVTTFKSGAIITDNGWLRSYKANGMSRNNMPLAAFTIELEGEDSTGTDNEVVT